MVVKSSSAPSSPADPLRGTQQASSNNFKKSKETEMEFTRLKSLVPTISKKQTVSKLDVILEAIRYIDQLQDQLIDQINERKVSLSVAGDLILGKENSLGHSSSSSNGGRMRHKSE
jgi:hypothetical protein